MGVGGVTLLMLVTMVLTTSPAFGKGCEPASVGHGRTVVTDRTVSRNDSSEQLGGRRDLSSRQIRPSGGGVCLPIALPDRSPQSIRRALGETADAPVRIPTDRVRVSLLNLPPPAC